MAPNTKHVHLVIQTLSPEELSMTKQIFPTLTSQESRDAPQFTSQERQDYWTWETERASDRDSYWDWSENPQKGVLSTEHVIKNLVHTNKEKTVDVVHSNVDSDSYWDETSAKDTESRTVTAQHEMEDYQGPENYWNWPAEKPDFNAMMIERILSDEKARQILCVDHIAQNMRQHASDLYWNEHEIEHFKDSLDYWNWQTTQQNVMTA
jgi:hypothetical protein